MPYFRVKITDQEKQRVDALVERFAQEHHHNPERARTRWFLWLVSQQPPTDKPKKARAK